MQIGFRDLEKDFYQKIFWNNSFQLFTEFAKLDPKVVPSQVVLEIGMGNGSNILPLIEASKNMENYKIYGCDFAPKREGGNLDFYKNFQPCKYG